MARGVVITHSATEGVARLGEWLEDAGLELQVVEPWNGDPVPEDLDGVDALVVMGGPQQAYDDASAAWLAEATGGRVAPGERGREAGARLVAKRDAAWDDELFADVPFTPTVVQWHEDAIVDLPPGAVHLAASSKYDNQAFRVGDRAWGLQFHVEVTPEMVRHWGAEYSDDLADGPALAERVVEELDEVEACWRPVAERFAALAQGRGRVVLPVVAG
jgi:GMP synthase-like glutamine amidotransferase